MGPSPSLADSMATRMQSTAYAPQWSIAIRNHSSSERIRRSGRVVANKTQLVILKALYARTGELATKAEIEEVVNATGLEARWVRKWIKRQRDKTRRDSDELSGGLAQSTVQVATLSSSEESCTTTIPPPASCLEVATGALLSETYIAANNQPFTGRTPVPLTFHATQSEALENTVTVTPGGCSSESSPQYHCQGVYLGTPPVSATRPAAFRPAHATSFQELTGPCSPGISFDRLDSSSSGATYNCVAEGSSATVLCPATSQIPVDLVGQSELPTSLTALLRFGSPPYEAYTGVQATFNQVPIAVDATSLPPVQPPQDHVDSSYHTTSTRPQSNITALPIAVFPETIAPTALSMPTSVPPTGLTVSAAYLYELFHGTTATSSAAPPEAPAFNSVSFLPELTRPSQLPPSLRAPLSAFASPTLLDQGFTGSPYPLTYQMRFSDLLALTKAIRGASASPTTTHVQETGSAAVPSEVEIVERPDAVDFEALQQLQYREAHVSPMDQDHSERIVAAAGAPTAVPGDVKEDGDETEDEAEVVTPCAENNFDLNFGLQADTVKKTFDDAVDTVSNGLVVVEDVTMAE